MLAFQYLTGLKSYSQKNEWGSRTEWNKALWGLSSGCILKAWSFSPCVCSEPWAPAQALSLAASHHRQTDSPTVWVRASLTTEAKQHIAAVRPSHTDHKSAYGKMCAVTERYQANIVYLVFTDIGHVQSTAPNNLQSETFTRRGLCLPPQAPFPLQTARIPTLTTAAKSNSRVCRNTHQTAPSPFPHLFAIVLFLHPARGLSATPPCLASHRQPLRL